LSRSEIDSHGTIKCLDGIDRSDVAVGKVTHVNVVAHPGTVGSGVIVAVHIEMWQGADGYAGYIGHQVVGDAHGRLAYESGFVGSDGIEIPQ